jgi:hypothetical protein
MGAATLCRSSCLRHSACNSGDEQSISAATNIRNIRFGVTSRNVLTDRKISALPPEADVCGFL